jgi:hypothetical protein
MVTNLFNFLLTLFPPPRRTTQPQQQRFSVRPLKMYRPLHKAGKEQKTGSWYATEREKEEGKEEFR